MTGWHRKGREASPEANESEIRIVERCRNIATGYWPGTDALGMVEAACQVDPYRTYVALTLEAATLTNNAMPGALLEVLRRHGVVIERDEIMVRSGDASAHD